MDTLARSRACVWPGGFKKIGCDWDGHVWKVRWNFVVPAPTEGSPESPLILDPVDDRRVVRRRSSHRVVLQEPHPISSLASVLSIYVRGRLSSIVPFPVMGENAKLIRGCANRVASSTKK